MEQVEVKIKSENLMSETEFVEFINNFSNLRNQKAKLQIVCLVKRLFELETKVNETFKN